jgi:adenylylsulfate kinase
LPNYFEVFVDVPLSEIKSRFPAKVYENLDIKSQIVGVDFEAEFPNNPDMRISGNLENFRTISRELASRINRREV